jgi:hypothetical protein
VWHVGFEILLACDIVNALGMPDLQVCKWVGVTLCRFVSRFFFWLRAHDGLSMEEGAVEYQVNGFAAVQRVEGSAGLHSWALIQTDIGN